MKDVNKAAGKESLTKELMRRRSKDEALRTDRKTDGAMRRRGIDGNWERGGEGKEEKRKLRAGYGGSRGKEVRGKRRARGRR